MNSFEIVRRALRFQNPERLPLLFDSLGFSDIAYAGLTFPSPRLATGIGADHFGCLWEKTDAHNMGQVKGHPLADWKALQTFPWPDPDNPAYYENIPAKSAQTAEQGKYCSIGIFMLLFERMHSLHGFEATLIDLYEAPDRCAELADRLVEFNIRVMRNAAEAAGRGRIHGLSFTDDWGTQLNAFVSPDFWRAFFGPRYRRIFDAAHALGWDVRMHSCGKVNDLIEPLIEVGVTSLNLQQPRALGIEEIGRRYRGRVCFESLCDIQQTLPFKDAAAIREEAARLIEHWSTDAGGFILSDYGDGAAIGVSDDRKRIMLDAFLKHDRWAARSGAIQPRL